MYRIFVDWLRRANRSPVMFVGRSGSTGAPFSRTTTRTSQAPDETWDPEALTERAFERERIAAAWARLHEQHRVVLSLHEIEGYSLEEVAAHHRGSAGNGQVAPEPCAPSPARIVDRGNEFPGSDV